MSVVALRCYWFFAHYTSAKLVDDALMWQRYAANLLSGHGVSWNVADGPVYGLTSLGYLLVAIPAHLLAPTNAVRGAELGGIGSAVLYLACSSALIFVACGAGASIWRSGAAFVLALIYPLLHEGFQLVLVGGMDTAFSCSLVCIFLILLIRAYEGRLSAWWLVALAPLLYVTRPEAGLYVAAALIVMLAKRGRSGMRQSATQIAVCGILFAITLLGLKSVFKTAIPLPALAKSYGHYTDNFGWIYRMIAKEFLGNYLIGYGWLILLAIGMSVILVRRRAESASLALGLLTTGLLYVAYIHFGVMQIMGHGERFFFPTVPAFLVVVGLGIRALVQKPMPVSTAALSAAGVLALGASALALTGHPHPDGTLESFFNQQGKQVWPALPIVAAQGLTRTAATDVGLMGVMMPSASIVDLAGLNDYEIATQGFRAEEFLEKRQPELIYCHLSYQSISDALVDAPGFLEDYEAYHLIEPATRLNVFVRRDAPGFAVMDMAFAAEEESLLDSKFSSKEALDRRFDRQLAATQSLFTVFRP
ncbi:MAG: hypothetical protein JSS72_12745 [Armatimonadetes bacterium]|nr:hypothetical protein [Armatimonadota bacterium]